MIPKGFDESGQQQGEKGKLLRASFHVGYADDDYKSCERAITNVTSDDAGYFHGLRLSFRRCFECLHLVLEVTVSPLQGRWLDKYFVRVDTHPFRFMGAQFVYTLFDTKSPESGWDNCCAMIAHRNHRRCGCGLGRVQ
jgi:hypothetical protein